MFIIADESHLIMNAILRSLSHAIYHAALQPRNATVFNGKNTDDKCCAHIAHNNAKFIFYSDICMEICVHISMSILCISNIYTPDSWSLGFICFLYKGIMAPNLNIYNEFS